MKPQAEYPYKVETETMECAKGVWAGMRPCWWTITHKATGFQLKVHEMQGMSQHKMRQYCIQILEMMIEDMQPTANAK